LHVQLLLWFCASPRMKLGNLFFDRASAETAMVMTQWCVDRSGPVPESARRLHDRFLIVKPVPCTDRATRTLAAPTALPRRNLLRRAEAPPSTGQQQPTSAATRRGRRFRRLAKREPRPAPA